MKQLSERGLPLQGSLWQQCLVRLENELPEQQFNTWIRPLHAIHSGSALKLLAPNRFVLDWVKDHYIGSIQQSVCELSRDDSLRVLLEVGSNQPAQEAPAPAAGATSAPARSSVPSTHRLTRPSRPGCR